MKKEKIAISINKQMLEMIDATVDGLSIRSRSQAVEYLTAKGIEHQYIKDAVILMRGSDAHLLLAPVERKPLLLHHLDWLKQHGVQRIYIIMGRSADTERIEALLGERNPDVRIVIDEKQAGTIPALLLVKRELARNFIVMLGDTLNLFDLTKMIIFHLKNDRIATIGLISTAAPEAYSRVELEGDRIVEFRGADSRSHVIDAGIYIFKPSIFKHFAQGKRSFEREVLPQLSRTDDIKGYFTHGEYTHLGAK